MADKQVEIEVVTATDIGPIEDLQTALEQTEESAEELSETIDETGTGNVSEVSGDFDEVANSADGATESVEEFQSSLDAIEASALMGVSNELSNFGAQAEDMAQDMNTAAISVGQLATNANMAESEMVGLITNISNATFPQEEAMAYVGALNQMGVESNKLGDAATNMDRINDATGMGYTNVMNLTQGLRSVGVEADQLPSSFNAIAYAQANVNGGAETMGKVFKRQAATINEYGLSVDQTVLIMSKLSEQGVSTTKMGTELSKVLKENNGDIQSIEQSLGMQAGTLSNASAETGKYRGQLQALADEEAEHKTIVDQLGAAWEDLSMYLSPVLAPMSSVMGLIGNAGSFAVGINGLVTLADSMKGLSIVTYAKAAADYVAAGAQWLLNAAMSANPIGILIIAIVALIAILGYLYFNNETVRNAINNLGQTFVQVGQIIYTAMINAVNWVIGALQNLWNYIITLGGLLPSNVSITGNNIIDTILRVVAFLLTLPLQIGIIFTNIIAKALGFGNNFAQRMFTAAQNSVTRFASQISQLPGKLATELQNMLSAVGEWAATLPEKFWQAGVDAVTKFLSALGIASPGTMQRMMVWEITEMGRRVPIESRPLLENISSLGEDVIDEFGNPTLGLGFDGTANATITSLGGNIEGQGQIINLNVEVGTVDSTDRVNEIVDAVRRELSWNNTTAGRTV